MYLFSYIYLWPSKSKFYLTKQNHAHERNIWNAYILYSCFWKAFEDWNKSELESFLIEITRDIMKFQDSDGTPLVEKIIDSAGQKGTGKWTAIASLEYGVPVTLIGMFQIGILPSQRYFLFCFVLVVCLSDLFNICFIKYVYLYLYLFSLLYIAYFHLQNLF